MTEMKIIKCSCKSDFQDLTYGTSMRAMNPTAHGQFRCTVCGTLHGAPSTAVTPVKKTTEPGPKVQPAAKKTPEKKTDNKGKEKKGSLKGGKR
jgi:hypothetical protein